jgi:hypothetical protein
MTIKSLFKSEKKPGLLQAVNAGRISFGRIRTSGKAVPAQPYQQPRSAFADALPAASTANASRKVVFFHIMKTGGVTFRHVLSSIYRDSFHIVTNPDFDSVCSALKSFDCIEFHTLPHQGDFAHMHTSLVSQGRWDLLQGADIFTMFRDPVDQVVSQYFYLMQKREFVEPAYRLNGVPFPETIEQYLDQPLHLNNQLAFLAGKYRLKPGNDLTRDDLDEVKRMLVNLNFRVGLTERFAESLHVFETVTERAIPGGKVVNLNQNPHRPPLQAISTRIKDRIRALSSFDAELYAFARELFSMDLAQCGAARRYTFIDMAAKSAPATGRPSLPAAPASRSIPPVMQPFPQLIWP